jgi:hypothetical protein
MLLTAAALLAASSAGAQVRADMQRSPIRGLGGIHAIVAQPVGPFGEAVDVGGGLNLYGLINAGPDSPLGLRLDGGFVIYGSETNRYRLSPTIPDRVTAKLTTTNSIFFLGAGPQLMATSGPIRPYVNGSVGFSVFVTSSSLSGDDDNDDDFNTTNQSDATLAYTGGAGFYIPLGTRTPVAIDLGAKYHGNGRVEYLRKGDITDNPDGSITINRRNTEANLVTYHIVVSVGIPGPRR